MKCVKFFISYSHLDSRWLKPAHYDEDSKELNTDLIPWLEKSLSNRYQVKFWYDHALKSEPGEPFKIKIQSEIMESDFALLLISSNFLNSEFIRSFEIPLIKEQVDKNLIGIIPILVGHTIWEVAPEFKWIAERQIIPGAPTPLIDYIDRPGSWERARSEILRAILNRMDNFLKGSEPTTASKPIPPPTPGKNPAIRFGRITIERIENKRIGLGPISLQLENK
jgi:hypothetical protein